MFEQDDMIVFQSCNIQFIQQKIEEKNEKIKRNICLIFLSFFWSSKSIHLSYFSPKFSLFMHFF